MQKKHRQEILLEIINSEKIATQEELLETLAKKGVNATQATLSRDLRELNLTKEKVDGVVRYVSQVQKQKNANIEKIALLLKSSLQSLEVVQFTLVVKTEVGDANVFAAYFDELKLEGVVGTIAGADTVLIITHDYELAQKLKLKIKSWLDL